MEVKEILESLGYTVRVENSEYLRCKPIYRESNNENALRIKSSTGFWQDYGTSEAGSLGELIRKTLGLESVKEGYEYLESNFKYKPNFLVSKPKINLRPKFSEDIVKSLIKDSSYWLNRRISQEVIDQFEGGIHKKTNRYYFIIRDSKNNIIGLCGRTLGNSKNKYLIRGAKQNFNYPLQLNCGVIQEKKEIILVEGIPEAMTLFTCGIKNCLVCFGIEVSNPLLTTLIKLGLKKIIITYNNDSELTGAGNLGAKKTYNKLLRYFDARQLEIRLPQEKDLNEQLINFGPESIRNWYTNGK